MIAFADGLKFEALGRGSLGEIGHMKQRHAMAAEDQLTPECSERMNMS